MLLLCGACGGVAEAFFTQMIVLASTIPVLRVAITSFKNRFRR